jgi:PTS system nitrogen regulatory IIA component
VTPPVLRLLQQRLRAAGGISWAPVGGGFAMPHLRVPVALGREGGILAVVLLLGGLTLGERAPDHLPVTRLLFFIAPSPRAHLELLGQLSAALTRGELRRHLLAASGDAEIYAALAAGARRRGEEGA